LGVSDRVDVLDEWVTDRRKAELLGGSLAVLSLPVDEDSYSYAALEGATAHKPIVTVSDAGGVLELVLDGVNGAVCDPSPESIGQAIDQLYADRDLARRQGDAQAEILDRLGLDWDHVVRALLS
jgi:glycosyltransferase involved in cell wall biosynthesis